MQFVLEYEVKRSDPGGELELYEVLFIPKYIIIMMGLSGFKPSKVRIILALGVSQPHCFANNDD